MNEDERRKMREESDRIFVVTNKDGKVIMEDCELTEEGKMRLKEKSNE